MAAAVSVLAEQVERNGARGTDLADDGSRRALGTGPSLRGTSAGRVPKGAIGFRYCSKVKQLFTARLTIVRLNRAGDTAQSGLTAQCQDCL